MTQRAIDVLRSVAWVAAEDTRHTAPLLRHYGISARLLAAHEHNEEAAAQQIIARLNEGESVALVSDAGTPAVSDPGARTVARVREAGYRIVPLPGPCAAVTALSASGLSEPHFLFYGFLPAKVKQREDALRELVALPSGQTWSVSNNLVSSRASTSVRFGPKTLDSDSTVSRMRCGAS